MAYAYYTPAGGSMPVLIAATATIFVSFQTGSLHITARDAFASGHTNNKKHSYNNGRKSHLKSPLCAMSNRLLVAREGFEPAAHKL